MISTSEKVKEIKRELETRKRLFPTWVLQGRISQNIANKRILILEEILQEYEQRLAEEDKQGRLFEEA